MGGLIREKGEGKREKGEAFSPFPFSLVNPPDLPAYLEA
jgi:hypothetical protein